MNKYLWENAVSMPKFTALDGDRETDVLVIGGGMAGILCAYMLQKQGVRCMVAEANTIGSGTTKGTTAVITAQHGAIYTGLLKKLGREKAGLYLNANLEAVDKYREMAEGFECDFENKPSYVYSITDKKKMAVEAAVIRELGFDGEFTEKTDLPFEVAGAVRFPNMAQFHPMKFIRGISENLDIREHTFVQKIEDHTAITDKGRIKAEKIIVASHYPFIKSHGFYPIKLYQKRSFVIVLKNTPVFEGTYSADTEDGIYLRNYRGMLIVGGGDYRTGKRNDGFKTVRRFVKGEFPQADEEYSWAAQDCMSLDSVPYIGRYSDTLTDIYVASGFNEWGMTSSMVSASIIADMIIGRENKYADVFAPDRSIMTTQLFSNIGETVMNLLTPTTKRCSHLGCALKKNIDENTWDCPCHGSRFDEQGHLIDNPAMRDARL